LESDLSAAREQLAEMREYADHKRECPARGLNRPMFTTVGDIEREARRECECGYFDMLSAAPAGGQEDDDIWEVCSTCNGGQTIGDEVCHKCGGAGYDLKDEE